MKSALEADSFITSSAGRVISDEGDGKLSINYTCSDGDVAFPTFADISGVVDVTISESTYFLRIPLWRPSHFPLSSLHRTQN